MSEIATYTFLPWLRQGIANEINGTDADGNRATIPISVTVTGDEVDGNGQQTATIQKNIEIYGPGDIVGIEQSAIVKVEPRNWITNFEPNYMPYIEFYDEDFPWRYTPFNPDSTNNVEKHRLKPWLALVVLKVNEFADGQNIKDRPLPFIKVKDTSTLQNLDQAWAWAHVHVNEGLVEGTESVTVDIPPDPITENAEKIEFTNTDDITTALQSLLNRNPDLAYSRIICPRKLEAKEAYHAFLVPAFETGRLAGLGQNPEGTNFDANAWDNTAATEIDLPFYHRWYFRSGTIGDFEYLVRLLEPKPVDSRVGTRDMDVQRPGANLKGLQDPIPPPGTELLEEEKLNGILKLGGALRIPASSQKDKAAAEKYEYWAFRGDKTPAEIGEIADKSNAIEQPLNIADLPPLQENIANFINLTDKYQDKFAVADEDTRILDINKNSGIDQAVDATDGNTEYDIKNNPDPLITAPLYGRWHALTQRLVKERDNVSVLNPNYNWVHELNLDPRWRVSAGFGTKVVQENQEAYMKAAWEQIGDVLEANKKIREAQLAKVVGEIWHQRHLLPITVKSEAQWLNIASPVHKRVLSSVTLSGENQQQLSVFYQKKESKLTTAATSVMMRKVMRPRGKFIKRVPFTETETPDNLITRINDGAVSAAPPRATPEGIQTPDDLVNASKPNNAPDFLLDWLKRFPWLRWIPLAIAILLILILIFFTPAVALVTVIGGLIISLIYLFLLMTQWLRQIQGAEKILEENQTPESVDELPKSPDFKITTPDEAFTPSFGGNSDSPEGQQFKAALKDVNFLIQESKKLGTVKERLPLSIATVNKAVFEKVNPAIAVPTWVNSGLILPPFIRYQQKEIFEEAEAYPSFDLPMYKPLADYSAELFLPNINFIDQNSISILETNQKFIEAYMVGLNHEFARELMWREYPTDQRGSYFRQFWETNGFMDVSTINRDTLEARYAKVFDEKRIYIPELVEFKEKLSDQTIVLDEAFLREAHRLILKEELKDIKPLHYWSQTSRLGGHDYRELPGDNEEEVVLVIRGELLKKYPTAVIYAHRAAWQDEDRNPIEYEQDEKGNLIIVEKDNIDNTKERTLYPINTQQSANPPNGLIKSPLYEAKVDPDIYFFGFDLTVPEAKGGDGSNPIDDPGWFFVIKERPGEPRFGLDIGEGGNVEANKIELWNDLSWGDITPAVANGGYLQITNATPSITANQPLESDDDEKILQQTEDTQISWHKDMNAAELAYILYQVPVLVAVHASEMLPD